MERLNLLPDNLVMTSWRNRVRFLVERQFLSTLVRAAGLVLTLVVALAVIQGVATQSYLVKTRALEAKQRKVSAELERISGIIADLEEKEHQLRKEVEWQGQRLAYLRAYQRQTGHWARTLREIKRALPYGVWLTELEGDSKKQLRLSGGAFQEDLVTEFMGDLKQVERFTDVAFTYTKKTLVGKTEVVQFEITCRIVDRQESGT